MTLVVAMKCLRKKNRPPGGWEGGKKYKIFILLWFALQTSFALAQWLRYSAK